MRILGIETSCDETSVALLTGDGAVQANLIASQIERHRPFGGVVPEIASREHLKHFEPVLDAALGQAGISLEEVDLIAVTAGPGLIGALLVGVAAAQGLSYGLDIPLIDINHLEGHIYSPYLRSTGPASPVPDRFLSVVVSGGHSSIYEVTPRSERTVRMLNRTRDDAAGEVFDKVAKFVGLPYPGGPEVERLSVNGDAGRYELPVARFKEESVDFSFSGLKAMAIRIARNEHLEGAAQDLSREESTSKKLADFCASVQRAIGDQLLDRLTTIWNGLAEQPDEVVLAGGVAANGALRSRLESWGSERDVLVRLPERRFCTDNGAMIAFAGLQKFSRGIEADRLRVTARSRMAVSG